MTWMKSKDSYAKEPNENYHGPTDSLEGPSIADFRRASDCLGIPLANLWIAYEAAQAAKRSSCSRPGDEGKDRGIRSGNRQRMVRQTQGAES